MSAMSAMLAMLAKLAFCIVFYLFFTRCIVVENIKDSRNISALGAFKRHNNCIWLLPCFTRVVDFLNCRDSVSLLAHRGSFVSWLSPSCSGFVVSDLGQIRAFILCCCSSSVWTAGRPGESCHLSSGSGGPGFRCKGFRLVSLLMNQIEEVGFVGIHRCVNFIECSGFSEIRDGLEGAVVVSFSQQIGYGSLRAA